MELHPHCEPLAFLLGTWRGRGAGHYPTIDPFVYVEEVSFHHVGKPFLSYTQKTKHADSGEPLHAESGYLRAVGDGQVEFVLVQPSGIVELHHARVSGTSLAFEFDAVHTTKTAKSVTAVTRTLAVEQREPDASPVLVYDVAMAAVGQPLTHHLHAELYLQ